MKRITPNRVALFVGVMTAVAVVIYAPRFEREQRQAQQVFQRQQASANEAAAQLATQNAAAKHTQFLEHYVDSAFTKKPGVQTVAVSVVSGDGKSDRAMLDAFTRHFQSETVQLLPSFFKPSFVSEGLFESALNGSDDVSKKLELARFLDKLLLARATVEYSTNGPDLENVITATMRLNVAVIPVAGNVHSQSWTFTAAGAGFNPTTAEAQAEERLSKQIADDKKIQL